LLFAYRENATSSGDALKASDTESGGAPRIGVITEDTVAARTSAEGGYDVFLYKGMKVRLSGK